MPTIGKRANGSSAPSTWRATHGGAWAGTVVIALVLGGVCGCKDRHAGAPPLQGATEIQQAAPDSRLVGSWRRPDGGYVLKITSVDDHGVVDAAYFNPNPIHVGQARATRDASATQVLVELRDVNYPGSTYRLVYDPAADCLLGTYFQAVTRETFEVLFERVQP